MGLPRSKVKGDGAPARIRDHDGLGAIATTRLPSRARWVTTGASMIAGDTLVHAFLHRTGTLRRLGADHPCGPGCYARGGCADILEGHAERTDAREFNPGLPATFPRFVQHAIWQFCAGWGWNICNGNRIDDRHSCGQRFCPAFEGCDRVAFGPEPDSLPKGPSFIANIDA